MYSIYQCELYTYVQGDLLYGPVSDGSVVQPPPVPNERALSRPMPHPSDRTVWRYYEISSGRPRVFDLRKLPTGRP